MQITISNNTKYFDDGYKWLPLTYTQTFFYKIDSQRDVNKTHTSILYKKLLPNMFLFTITLVLPAYFLKKN